MKSEFIRERCPICWGKSASSVGHLNYALFDDLKMSGKKNLLSCNTCGMLYDKVSFMESDLKRYYRINAHYAVADTGGTGGMSDDNKERYDRILDILSPSRSGRILDYGCGQGGFVARSVARGWETVGIEPSKHSRNVGLSAGLNIYASLKSYLKNCPPAPIETVILSHTLEHMLNPLNAIKKLASIAPNALIYIEVPDANAYLSPAAIRWHELYFEHICHFHGQALQNLADLVGIKTNRTGEIPFSKNQSKTKCIFLAGEIDGIKRTSITNKHQILKKLPDMPEIPYLKENKFISIWGVSQYAMLLLGSYNGLLKKVNRLFDSSPAKIGRRINGIKIEPSQNLKTLSPNELLLIPKSAALEKMVGLLPEIGFMGQFVIV